jgi:hypothetical protein
MTDPETEFNDLLAALKTPPFLISNELLTTLMKPPELTVSKESPYKSIEYDNLIKVMESGIFYKGGLKGKILLQTHSGQVKDRKVWPISNLKELLVKLAALMVATTDPEKNVKEFVSGYFENLLKAFDTPAALARLGGIRKSSIDKTKQDLLNWKEKTIHKIPTFPKTAPNEIAEILLAHLPTKTPDLTIAERIKELMAAFNQESGKIQTLRKMVAKMRKK